jgi:mannose-6-phosphate isomerase-like protein (cupin superfamily)
LKRKTLTFRPGFRVTFRNLRAQAAVMVLAPGTSEGSTDNRHRGADQWLYVIEGKGAAIVNRRRVAISAGMLMLIERGDRHEIRNTGRRLLKTLNLYVPPAYAKDDSELRAGRR